MMKTVKHNIQLLVVLTLSLNLFSCGIGKPKHVDNSVNGRAKVVLSKAHDFVGTPYQWGGTTKRGMDCSGLALVSFQEVGVQLPRNSAKQAAHGTKIKLKHVKPGDMLFFNTSGRGISHVGIVDHLKNDEIFFIHASSSKGVMVSSLENKYWKKRFVKAVRYLH